MKKLACVLALMLICSVAVAKELPRNVGPLILEGEAETVIPVPLMINGKKHYGAIIYHILISNPTQRDYALTIYCDFYDENDHLISSTKIENNSKDMGPIIVKAGMTMGGKAFFAFRKNVFKNSKYHNFRIVAKPRGTLL
jgi:hypothetical protein